MKKILSVLLVLAALLAMATSAALAAEIALVTDVGTIDDESFNQACWEGVKAYAEAHGKTYQYYQPGADSTDERLNSIDLAVSEGALSDDYKDTVLSAATIEELAEKLSINAEGLKASVEQYNADAAAGAENAQIAAVPKRALDAEGPYYGVRVEAANHMTKGGVVCNENAQVLNADDTVVPGLYAAGEVTGGVHGANRLGGNAVADFTVFGRIAGAAASKYAA